MSNPLARRARIKDLSNKAEGIFQYVGNDNVLFRLISTGNKLTSDVNYAVALFTGFARSHQLSDFETRRTIDSIYRRVGELMCLIDIVHAAAGEEIVIVLVRCVTISVSGTRFDKTDGVWVLCRTFVVVRHPTNDSFP